MKKLGVFIPILLTIILVFSMVPSAYAATVELKYDDGSAEAGFPGSSGYYVAVKFSLPSGWNDAKLITARYYIYGVDGSRDFNVHIFGSDGNTRLFGPLTVTAVFSRTWLDVDLSSYDIIISEDFYIAMEFVEAALSIGDDFTDPDGRSYENNPDDWNQISSIDMMIRAIVEEYTTPVGGIYAPTDKLSILTPFIALVGLIGAISSIFFMVKKRRD